MGCVIMRIINSISSDSPLSSGKDIEAGRATSGRLDLEGLSGGEEESKGGNRDLHGDSSCYGSQFVVWASRVSIMVKAYLSSHLRGTAQEYVLL